MDPVKKASGQSSASGSYSRNQTNTDENSTPAVSMETGPFIRLPVGVWLRIMSFLPLSDRYHMTVSCDLFRQLFFHSYLWRSVELACVLAGDRENGHTLVLRPCHKQIALQFGHLFHFVSLHVPHMDSPVQEETARILLGVTERSRLKGLKITSGFARQTSAERDVTVTSHSCPGLVIEMLKKATSLRYLDLSNWSVFHSDLHENQLNVLNVLLLSDTCPRLESLNIATNVMLYSDSLELFRKTVVRLAFKFVHLCHLQIRQILLSDLLLHELASARRDRLQTLTVLTCEPEGEGPGETPFPDIPETSWAMLRSSCPGLELHLRAEVAHVPCIRWAMKPHVPVVSVELRFCSLPADLLSCLQQTYSSLRSLTCYVLPGHPYDLPLTQVVTACTRLQHLVFYGKVHSHTILQLASMPRQWRTFRFRLKHIILVENAFREQEFCADRDDGAGCRAVAGKDRQDKGGGAQHSGAERKDELDRGCVERSAVGRKDILKKLCVSVSAHLGYSWTPCDQ